MFVRHVNDHNMHRRFTQVAPEGSDLDFQFWNAAKRIIALQEMMFDESYARLPDRLLCTAEFSATDPRDKVYGVLAMSKPSESRPDITPEYSKSVREVFLEAVFWMILEEPWTLYMGLPLHHLRRAHAPFVTTVPDMPSWAMDLTITSQSADAGYYYNRPHCLFSSMIYSWLSETAHRSLGSITRQHANNRIETVGAQIGTVAATSRNLLLSQDGELRPPGTVPLPVNDLRRIYNDLVKPYNISTESFLRNHFAGSVKWQRICIDDDDDFPSIR